MGYILAVDHNSTRRVQTKDIGKKMCHNLSPDSYWVYHLIDMPSFPDVPGESIGVVDDSPVRKAGRWGEYLQPFIDPSSDRAKTLTYLMVSRKTVFSERHPVDAALLGVILIGLVLVPLVTYVGKE